MRPSFNELGFTWSEFQGPYGAFSFSDTKSFGGRAEMSGRPPFLMGNCFHIFPADVREAIRLIAERGAGAINAFWRKQLSRVRRRARAPLPVIKKIRETVDPERRETRARIHAPLLKALTRENDMGGADWARSVRVRASDVRGARGAQGLPS